jgi:RHH-type proline utilization regulon transcriptional repressor/proline dehydrogenase/delta 1-pyrroline-5-carboxylate dehydrogenase
MEQGGGDERAHMLRHAADALEAQLPRFSALLVREAFKTWNDSVCEVREAVDFLRYYAAEAERIMQPRIMPGHEGDALARPARATSCAWWRAAPGFASARGTFRWRSSWARWRALATGNTVLAKPAEQTPAWRWSGVKLLHAAGVPARAATAARARATPWALRW